MHSVLMWFLMLNLPFHFPLKSPGKCSHAKNKKTNKTIPPYISFLVLTISTNTEPKDSICSSPSRNPTFFALLSSQFEKPKSHEKPNLLFSQISLKSQESRETQL